MQATQTATLPRLDQVGALLNCVKGYVSEMREGKASSPVIPLWQLRTLGDKCLHAGFPEASELCFKIESRILGLYVSREGAREDIATELSHVADSLSELAYVEALATGLHQVRRI